MLITVSYSISPSYLQTHIFYSELSHHILHSCAILCKILEHLKLWYSWGSQKQSVWKYRGSHIQCTIKRLGLGEVTKKPGSPLAKSKSQALHLSLVLRACFFPSQTVTLTCGCVNTLGL